MKQVRAEIIAIGSEILLGEITDTNSVHMARSLRHNGIEVQFMTAVDDHHARIASAIQIALSRAEVVITCGGLGPTVDDMTRDAIAMATDRSLVFQEVLYEQIVERFQRFRSQMTANNKRQAYLPENAIPIENPVGTAPGFIVEVDNQAIISLPGVPREMKFLMVEAVIPYLQAKYQTGVITARTLRVAGIGESSLDDKIGEPLLSQENPAIGLAAHHGVIDVRMTVRADNDDDAAHLLQITEIALRDRIDEYIFGVEDDRLEVVFMELLNKQQGSFKIIEAGLKGAISNLLLTANIAKDRIQVKQYDHPADFEDSSPDLHSQAEYLAKQTLEQSDPFTGVIVLLSLPDVDEGADNEQATAVSVMIGDKVKTRTYGFGAKATVVQGWVSRWAIANGWRMLKEMNQHVD